MRINQKLHISQHCTNAHTHTTISHNVVVHQPAQRNLHKCYSYSQHSQTQRQGIHKVPMLSIIGR
jgi:hypothetical protein